MQETANVDIITNLAYSKIRSRQRLFRETTNIDMVFCRFSNLKVINNRNDDVVSLISILLIRRFN